MPTKRKSFVPDELNVVQRAMMAARMVTSTPGQRPIFARWRRANDGIVTVADAAKAMNVSPGSIAAARRLIAEGTEEEIAAADAGTLPLDAVYKQIRKGIQAEHRVTIAKPKSKPRPGSIAVAVLARIAADEERKQEKKQRAARPRLVKNEPETGTEAPAVLAAPEVVSLNDAVFALLQAMGQLSVDQAAQQMIDYIGAPVAHRAFAPLLLWLIDVGDKLAAEDELTRRDEIVLRDLP